LLFVIKYLVGVPLKKLANVIELGLDAVLIDKLDIEPLFVIRIK